MRWTNSFQLRLNCVSDSNLLPMHLHLFLCSFNQSRMG